MVRHCWDAALASNGQGGEQTWLLVLAITSSPSEVRQVLSLSKPLWLLPVQTKGMGSSAWGILGTRFPHNGAGLY